eukprot:snap_masked-scaffold_28-processed-gene-3.50-mRNA-1 protein AED:1.00 eAED:1.00 QI:0/0/0/0/1/1/2/0/73
MNSELSRLLNDWNIGDIEPKETKQRGDIAGSSSEINDERQRRNGRSSEESVSGGSIQGVKIEVSVSLKARAIW